MTTPTPKELELLRAIDMSEYGDNIMDDIWTWSATDNIEMTEENGITEASMGGIIASAAKKGLIYNSIDEEDSDENSISMTDEGFEAYIAHFGRENMNKWKDKSDLTDQLAIDAATRLENA